jgi:hypothetical protein
VPSLILQGEKDEYATQEHCTEIAKKISTTACPLLLERTLSHKENPSLISQTIYSFLNKDHENTATRAASVMNLY